MLNKILKKLSRNSLIIFSLLALASQASFGVATALGDDEVDTETKAASPLFQSDSILEVTLKTNLPQLIRDRSKSYHSADVEVVDPAVRGSRFRMKVSTRGMTSLRTCNFPHIRFKFDPETVKSTIFKNLSKVKLVAHCDNPDLGNSHQNEQKEVVLQYTLYRMYNLLTDYSIKVRLARMHYVDTTNQMQSITRYAFFIEPTESVAARHGASPAEPESVNGQGISGEQLNATYAGMDAAYQFLIGNGDWRLLRGNYVDLLNSVAISGNNIGLLTMPYDMDRAGMCNGDFAFHSIYADGATFPIVGDDAATIRDIYAEEFQNRSFYKTAFSRFRNKRQEMYKLYDSMKSLIDSRYRDRTVGHLDRFFEAIGTREDAQLADIVATSERP
jgi:hypothetical protein